MKLASILLFLLFSLTATARKNETLKYSCHLDRSTMLKIYEVRAEGSRQISIKSRHFTTGEKEIHRLTHPFIVDYGNVYMVTQNNGRSGYIFLRLETRESSSEIGFNTKLLMDDNLFDPSNMNSSKGKGTLTVFKDCSKKD